MKYPQLHAGDVLVGTALPEISMAVPFHKVVMTPYATWDFFPGHNDPDYARAQGQKTIYLNTVALQGFADRLVTGWTGPATFVSRRKMVMKSSVYAGDTLSAGGTVQSVSEDGAEITISLWLRTEAALVCEVETSIRLPARPHSHP